MPLTTLIVDDEQLAREELQYLLERTGKVTILGQGTNGIEAVSLIKSLKPDVVFLDVQMPGLDGFAVIKKLLDGKTKLPEIVFATAFDQYAVRAFEVNAVDYLLKPFDRDRVLQTIDKAAQRIADKSAPNGDNLGGVASLVKWVENQQSKRAGKVVVRFNNRLLLVDQKEICYASIGEGTITVGTSTMEGQSNCRTLDELQDQLDTEMFWRAHRSFVVNIQHIREVVPWFKSSYQLRMDDRKQTEIPVSRSQTKRLRELFNL